MSSPRSPSRAWWRSSSSTTSGRGWPATWSRRVRAAVCCFAPLLYASTADAYSCETHTVTNNLNPNQLNPTQPDQIHPTTPKGFKALVASFKEVTGSCTPYSITGSLPCIRELQVRWMRACVVVRALSVPEGDRERGTKVRRPVRACRSRHTSPHPSPAHPPPKRIANPIRTTVSTYRRWDSVN
jgi:hypothetical protein